MAGALEALLCDLRHAVRPLARAPGFTLVAVATLGLAIGANAAAFGGIYGALLRPPPFPGADRLVLLSESNPRSEWQRLPFSSPDYAEAVTAVLAAAALTASWFPARRAARVDPVVPLRAE
jgi:putative ABC transport system permease protein